MSILLGILIGYFGINFILGVALFFWFKTDDCYGLKPALGIFLVTLFAGIPMLVAGGIRELFELK